MRELLAGAVSLRSGAERELEAAFALRFGFDHAVFFPYARSAVFALCKVMGWSGREALCPAYTCAVVPGAIAASGTTVRFVDSAADHFLPDAASWERELTNRTALAVVSPLFGYPVQDDVFNAARSKAPEAFVLLDEAQSYSSENVARAGSRIDGALFSLGAGKLVSALSGGVLLLRDAQLAAELRSLMRSRSAMSDLFRAMKLGALGLAAILAFREPALSLLHAVKRTNAVEDPNLPADALDPLPAMAARVGLMQFKRIDELLVERRRIGSYYDRRLREEDFQTFAYGQTPTWVRFPLAVRDREAVQRALHKAGVQVGLFLDYECSQLARWSNSHPMPNARRWAKSMINLPNWSGISTDIAERVIQALKCAGDAAGWP